MKTKPNSPVEQVKNFIRQPYIWPGGYPLFIVCMDGGAVCRHCAKENARLIISETRANYGAGWAAAGVDVNWEDTELTCDTCGRLIESAYGEQS